MYRNFQIQKRNSEFIRGAALLIVSFFLTGYILTSCAPATTMPREEGNRGSGTVQAMTQYGDAKNDLLKVVDVIELKSQGSYGAGDATVFLMYDERVGQYFYVGIGAKGDIDISR